MPIYIVKYFAFAQRYKHILRTMKISLRLSALLPWSSGYLRVLSDLGVIEKSFQIGHILSSRDVVIIGKKRAVWIQICLPFP